MQILVNYSRMLFSDFEKMGDVNKVVWDVNETRLFINTEGCGYPPRVNCTNFAREFGHQNLGITFPCYYSRTYPEMVVTRYSWNTNLR